MEAVKILSASKILPISNNSPLRNDTIPLSFHDSCWVPFLPTQRLFLYPPSDNLNFHTIVESLKSSLAFTLPFFHVLTGKLAYDPSSKLVFIDCSKDAVGEGVSFIEAQSETLDFDRLEREEVHDHDAFNLLVPSINIVELPIPVFAVQVTRFTNGSVAVGMALHHSVMDGKGLWQFVPAWAKNCRSGNLKAVSSKMAVHDRSIFRFEGDEEAARGLLKNMVPNLPKLKIEQPEEHFSNNHNNLAKRTFTIDKASILTLKKIPLSQDPTRVSSPSTFASLMAHTWISLTRARVNAYGSKYPNSHLLILIDLRAHLNPPVDQSYTGNCIGTGYVHVSCTDLLGPTGFAHACSSIEKVVMARRKNPLLGCMDWAKDFMSIPHEMMVNVSSSPKFRAYDTDFGWAKPSRVESVSMHRDGEVTLFAGKDEGTVQISVSVAMQFMDEFANYFLSGLET